MIRILVVDDNASIREILSEAFNDRGYKTDNVDNGASAIEFLKKNAYDIVITDLKMSGIGGLELLKYIKLNYPYIETIIITAYGTIDAAVESMRSGAYDFIVKPFQINEIEKKIDNIARQIRLYLNNEYLQREIEGIFGYKQIVGNSRCIKRALADIAKVAPVNSTVLICGETGTGKELIARYIHYNSPRKNNAFVKVNCAALPSELLESELFGHEKGAFTSAYKDRIGRFELADKGTIFIDEISEIPYSTQIKLLRVIQEREFERVGSSDTIRSDVRIISSTNRNLEEMVNQNKFRRDLYYRLNVFPIFAPPLRERKEDIPQLVDFFIEKYANSTNKKIHKIETPVIDALTKYNWPGNVRELENIIERMIVISDCGIIKLAHLPQEIKTADFALNLKMNTIPNETNGMKLPEFLANIEKKIVEDNLKANNFNQSKTAEILGIGRTDLQYKIKKYGLLRSDKNDLK